MEQETNPGGGQGERGDWGLKGLQRGECGGRRRQQVRREVMLRSRLPEPVPPRR